MDDWTSPERDPGDVSDICGCGDTPDEWDEECPNIEQHEAEHRQTSS